MQPLETQDWWPELLRLKDSLSLKQLAERFGVNAGAISSALRRVDSVKSVSDDDLPPEAGADDAEARRRGSKDSLLFALSNKIGTVPDNEIARLAGVSLRTVASFRSRNKIPAYDGPRRRKSSKKPAAATSTKGGTSAWLVSFRNSPDCVILGDSLLRVVESIRESGEVVKVSWVGHVQG